MILCSVAEKTAFAPELWTALVDVLAQHVGTAARDGASRDALLCLLALFQRQAVEHHATANVSPAAATSLVQNR